MPGHAEQLILLRLSYIYHPSNWVSNVMAVTRGWDLNLVLTDGSVYTRFEGLARAGSCVHMDLQGSVSDSPRSPGDLSELKAGQEKWDEIN